MIDIAQQISAINRQVAVATVQDTESVVVTAERRYPAEVTDVWYGPHRSGAGAPLVHADLPVT